MKQIVVKFDAYVLGRVQRWPGWLYIPMFVITTVGHPVMQGVVLLWLMFTTWQNGSVAWFIGLVAAFIAMAGNTVLKHFIHRTRPDTLYVSRMWFATSSFPSGHSFGATVTAGMLAVMANRYLAAPWDILSPVLLVGFIGMVGLSRIYLGAHYPSDVVAGWLLGGSALVAIIWMCGL